MISGVSQSMVEISVETFKETNFCIKKRVATAYQQNFVDPDSRIADIIGEIPGSYLTTWNAD